MKLLFITKDDCPYCIEKREMVYQQLPEIFEGLVIQEYNISYDAELVKPYYPDTQTPAFVFLTDEDEPMFTVTGVPGPRYIKKLFDSYQSTTDGTLNDDELEMVVGGVARFTAIPCNKNNEICIQ